MDVGGRRMSGFMSDLPPFGVLGSDWLQGGYIFQYHHKLSFPPKDKIYKTSISYHDILDDLKYLWDYYFSSDQKLGTHTRRKTSYLIAVWGCLNILNLMKISWHKCYLTACAYMQDCESLKNVKLVEENDPNQSVSAWRAIYCDNLLALQAMTAPYRPY